MIKKLRLSDNANETAAACEAEYDGMGVVKVARSYYYIYSPDK